MKVSHYFGREQRRLAAEAAMAAVWFTAGTAIRRMRLSPSLPELAAAVNAVHMEAPALLRELGITYESGMCESSIDAEYEEATERLSERYSRIDLAYPHRWAVEAKTSRVLYATIRILRPARLVEIGVGNGHSTYYILNAIRRNGVGRLVSFDVRRDVGGLLALSDTADWQLETLRGRGGDRGLRQRIQQLEPIDWCLHDGDHSYIGQLEDFQMIIGHLNPGGLLICDDADASFAFLEACRRNETKSAILLETRKAVGFIVSEDGGHSSIGE